jgi:hypothetical protein
MFIALPRKVDTMLPRFDTGHEHGKQTNKFATHEQLRAAASLTCCFQVVIFLIWECYSESNLQ